MIKFNNDIGGQSALTKPREVTLTDARVESSDAFKVNKPRSLLQHWEEPTQVFTATKIPDAEGLILIKPWDGNNLLIYTADTNTDIRFDTTFAVNGVTRISATVVAGGGSISFLEDQITTEPEDLELPEDGKYRLLFSRTLGGKFQVALIEKEIRDDSI